MADYLVMAYFTTAVEELHLALSDDGTRWTPLGAPVLRSTVGAGSVRDPFLTVDADGIFHLVATDGWASTSIVHAWSRDLLTWHDLELIPVMAGVPGCRNAWAPEVFRDVQRGGYCVIWSSVVQPVDDDRWSDPHWRSATTHDHRIWLSRTPDFVTWSAPELFFDPGYSVIDATVLWTGTRYLMAFKDERGTNADPAGYKGIRLTGFDTVGGRFDEPSAIVTTEPAEGPILLDLAGERRLVVDHFLTGTFGCARSTDDLAWSPVPGFAAPPGARHACVLAVDEGLYRTMERRQSCDTGRPCSPLALSWD